MLDPEQTIRPDLSHPYLPGREPAYPLLRVLSGPLEGREFTLTADRYAVGRDVQSDIVIAQPEVSRRHAEIIRMASEYVVMDLKSANGIYINNLKLDRAVLHHGDVFQIGSCVFQFIWSRHQSSPP
ncbi:MAG: FHA domain-containing protein [Nitrospirota bacterium]